MSASQLRKKILLVSVQSSVGGGPKNVDLIVKHLIRDYKFFVAAPMGTPLGQNWKELLGEDSIFELPHRKFELLTFLRFLSFIQKNEIKTLHAHGRGAALYTRLASLFLPSLKIIITLHGFHFEDLSPLKRFLLKCYELFFIKGGREIILCVSASEKNEYQRFLNISSNAIEVIPNGLTTPEVLNIPMKDFCSRVVSICRFDKVKNLKEIVHIASELKDNTKIEFELYGSGDDYDLVQSSIDTLGLKNVRLMGEISDPYTVLETASLYIATSKKEGLPYSLLEAMSVGLPIVATNVPGHMDCVQHGSTGFLYRLGDTKEAARLISSILSDSSLRESLSKNSRLFFLSHFKLEEALRRIGQVYSLS